MVMPASLPTRAHRWMELTLRRVGQDRLYYFIIASFVAATAATANRLHCDGLIDTIWGYLTLWADLAVAVFTARFSSAFILRSWKERPRSPVVLAKDVALELFLPKTVAGVLLYLALAVFMGAFTTFKTLLPRLNDFWADPWLAGLDRWVHGGRQSWHLLQPLLGHPPITHAIEFVYGPVWISCVSLLPLFFCLSDRYPEDRPRFLVAFLITWMFNGLLLAGVFMSGGPAFYGRLLHDDAVYGDLQRYLDLDAATPFSTSWAQHALWSMQQAGISGVGAGISAFPSLHISMIMLCCLSVWNISRRVGFLFLAIAAVIVIGSVHLGWHYLVGDYAVFAIMGAIWRASGFLAAQMRTLESQFRFAGDASNAGSPIPGAELPARLGSSETWPEPEAGLGSSGPAQPMQARTSAAGPPPRWSASSRSSSVRSDGSWRDPRREERLLLPSPRPRPESWPDKPGDPPEAGRPRHSLEARRA